jgi:serine/threonine-protein kinase RsbW
MNQTDQSKPAAALGRHELELRMLALREHVPGLRALAAERAMRNDHDLDFIDDVRLVVDEVCGLMLAHCADTDVLTMRLLVDAQCVRIDASVPTFLAEPMTGTLSLRVLAALADSLDYWIDDDGPTRVFRLTFGRLRPRRR